MTFYGLHWADLLMIGLYLGAMVYIGQRTARTVKKQTDLYLGGRKLGKALQFFLNFGNMTDLNNTVTTSSAVYGRRRLDLPANAVHDPLLLVHERLVSPRPPDDDGGSL